MAVERNNGLNQAKIWFAWACTLSRLSVEPLYEAAVKAGYDCELRARGGYDDLPERMRPYTHYVFGVGPDVSWNMARDEGLVGINIMHGQYIFDTWYAPIPEHTILTGEAYIDSVSERFRDSSKLYTPGYIRAEVLREYEDQDEKDIRCLVALPKIDEHGLLDSMAMIDLLSEFPGVVFRVHPRNSSIKADFQARGLVIDESPNFYDSLSRSRCLLSGPSNCIIESCIHGVPVGLFALPCPMDFENPRSEQARRFSYFKKLEKSYSPMATVFQSKEQLITWIESPAAKPRENARRYWANDDGDIQPVIDCFLNILRSTLPGAPA